MKLTTEQLETLVLALLSRPCGDEASSKAQVAAASRERRHIEDLAMAAGKVAEAKAERDELREKLAKRDADTKELLELRARYNGQAQQLNDAIAQRHEWRQKHNSQVRRATRAEEEVETLRPQRDRSAADVKQLKADLKEIRKDADRRVSEAIRKRQLRSESELPTTSSPPYSFWAVVPMSLNYLGAWTDNCGRVWTPYDRQIIKGWVSAE